LPAVSPLNELSELASNVRESNTGWYTASLVMVIRVLNPRYWAGGSLAISPTTYLRSIPSTLETNVISRNSLRGRSGMHLNPRNLINILNWQSQRPAKQSLRRHNPFKFSKRVPLEYELKFNDSSIALSPTNPEISTNLYISGRSLRPPTIRVNSSTISS
jgi:hypothetical protein